MKKKILTFVFLLITINVFGQHLHVIRFIHGGDELKPIGTVVISVEKVVLPTDKPLDPTFGISIKTDIKTFKIIRKLIKREKYTTKPDEFDNSGFLKIVDSSGFVLLLDWPKYKDFFYDLRSILKKKKNGQDIINAFKYY
jgi:hypothetical protein